MTFPPPLGTRIALDFDALYRAARDDVFAYVATMLHDRGAAEDVTAPPSSARSASARPTTPPRQRARLAVRHRPQRRARRAARGKRTATLVAEPADVSPAPEEELEHTLRRAALRTALAELPARDRELIALKFHAGLDNSELAEVLGVSVSNAGTRLHRALTKLREILDDQS